MNPIDYQRKVVERIKLLKEKERQSDLDNREKINPLVVALLVSPEGHEIYSYRSELMDGDHAEYNLFVNKLNGKDHSKDTLYVSLEPCNHDSRLNTISCSELIVKSRIKTVYMGCFDPDILVRGNGYAYLKEHGVQVIMFEESLQKELIDNNWPFFSDKLYHDENSRRFVMTYKPLLSMDAIVYYLMSLEDEQDDYNPDAVMEYMHKNPDYFKKFYGICFEKKYIYNDVKNNKRIVSSDIGFNLAFFKNPSAIAKGAYIMIIDNRAREVSSQKFDQPILIAYTLAIKSLMNILRQNIYNENILLVIRELLANAVFHKDYHSYAPIIVKIYNDTIEITNPCNTNYIDVDYLNKFEMPTNPINGSLTEIAIDISLMEGQGKGAETIRRREVPVKYELITNILKTTISLL